MIPRFTFQKNISEGFENIFLLKLYKRKFYFIIFIFLSAYITESKSIKFYQFCF